MINFDKSIFFNFEQPENILLMFSTFLVLKFDKSIDSNDEQPENKPFIYFIFSVLNIDVPIDVRDRQSLNILLISFIFSVLKRLVKLIDFIFLIPLNISFKELTSSNKTYNL